MNEIKTILLLGGTGFVGRAVTEKYLSDGWRIIIPTRNSNISKARKKLILHGFDNHNLEKFTKDSFILFAPNIDLADKKWLGIDNWLKLFDKLNISTLSVLRVLNLMGETSKSANEILKSNADVADSALVIVRYLKSQNKKVIFGNMGSTAEKKQSKKLPPYEKAKKIVKQKIEESNLCDYHFVANYIKGRGEQKMKSIAPYLWDKLKFSRKWLFGFNVSVIDVDDLAEMIYYIFEIFRDTSLKQKPIEVNVTSGELLFGEMIKNLLLEDKIVMPKSIIPACFENYFLRFYAFVIPLIKPESQLFRRLANFAKKGSMNPVEREKLRVFKTAEEIKKLAMDTTNYSVLKTNSNLVVISKHSPVIYVLQEKSKEELKQIIRKAIVLSD